MVEGIHDVRFPTSIALGSRGGPVRRTEIVTLASGHETRRARWSQSRRQYNAGYGIKCRADIEQLVAFFEAREGRRYAFRWRDPFDYRSTVDGQSITATDQTLGTGDGSITSFQLVKRYDSGGVTRTRPVTHPVAGTVLVALNGTPLIDGTDFTVNTQTGSVEFVVAPGIGAAVTAGFEFDIPARFDTDALVIAIQATGGSVPNIPIVEVRA